VYITFIQLEYIRAKPGFFLRGAKVIGIGDKKETVENFYFFPNISIYPVIWEMVVFFRRLKGALLSCHCPTPPWDINMYDDKNRHTLI